MSNTNSDLIVGITSNDLGETHEFLPGFFISFMDILCPVFGVRSCEILSGTTTIYRFPSHNADVHAIIDVYESPVTVTGASIGYSFTACFNPVGPEAATTIWLSLLESALAFSYGNQTPNKPPVGYNGMALCPSILDQIPVLTRYALSEATVFISGPIGSGKTFLSHLIHALSRSSEPCIELNLATIPESLVDLELFGHARGAFTDATEEKHGKLFIAGQGSLIIDGIDVLSFETQYKLHSVLQHRQYYPLGSNTPTAFSARVIVVSRLPALELASQGKLQTDLLYLINVLPLFVEPISARNKDIGFFLSQFLEKTSRKCNKRIRASEELLRYMERCEWPGNIHEINSYLEACLVQSDSDMLGLPQVSSEPSHEQKDLKESINQYKKKLIHDIVRQCAGNQSKAAKLLGIQRTYLSRLIKELSIPL
jgi:DNA-binding NtrC family response regulator